MKKKLLTLVLALAMVLSLVPAALAAEFDDTEGYYGEEAIDRWAEYGVVEGVGGGDFNPKGTLTRAQAAEIISNLMHLTEKGDISAYTDVTADKWYAEPIAKCVAAGILNGTGATTMSPGKTCDRETMFVMVARAVGIKPETTCDKDFNDSTSVHSWAKGYINALVNIGAVDGKEGNILDPVANVSRGQSMVFLDKLIGLYVVEEGEATIPEEGIVLVLADNVQLKGTATKMPIVIAGEAESVDMKGVEGTATVIVKTDDVEITNAPAGTEIITEDAENVTVNGAEVKPEDDIVVTAPSTPSTGGTGGTVTPPAPTNYSVTATVTPEGSATVTLSTESTTAGTTVTVTVKANVGYEVESVKANDTDATAGADNTYTFTMPAENVTVAVTMKAVTYTVTFNANGGAFKTDNPSTCPQPGGTDDGEESSTCPGPDDKESGDDASTCTDPAETCPGDKTDTCGDQGTTCPGEDNTTCGGGENTGSGEGTTTCPGGDNWTVGSGATTATLSVLSGDVIDFSKVAVPVWENYTFIGWYTTYNGEGTRVVAYENGAYGTSTYKVTGDVTLYAIWKDAEGHTCYGGENNTPGSGEVTQP